MLTIKNSFCPSQPEPGCNTDQNEFSPAEETRSGRAHIHPSENIHTPGVKLHQDPPKNHALQPHTF